MTRLMESLSIRFLVGQPLGRESRPFERASVQHVVEEDRVLLPYLVFLVDDLVLDLFLVLHLALFELICREKSEKGSQAVEIVLQGRGCRCPLLRQC